MVQDGPKPNKLLGVHGPAPARSNAELRRWNREQREMDGYDCRHTNDCNVEDHASGTHCPLDKKILPLSKAYSDRLPENCLISGRLREARSRMPFLARRTSMGCRCICFRGSQPMV